MLSKNNAQTIKTHKLLGKTFFYDNHHCVNKNCRNFNVSRQIFSHCSITAILIITSVKITLYQPRRKRPSLSFRSRSMATFTFCNSATWTGWLWYQQMYKTSAQDTSNLISASWTHGKEYNENSLTLPSPWTDPWEHLPNKANFFTTTIQHKWPFSEPSAVYWQNVTSCITYCQPKNDQN